MRALAATSSVFLLLFAWLGQLWREHREERDVTRAVGRGERGVRDVQLVLRRTPDGRVRILVLKTADASAVAALDRFDAGEEEIAV